jgi:hypothetical protein
LIASVDPFTFAGLGFEGNAGGFDFDEAVGGFGFGGEAHGDFDFAGGVEGAFLHFEFGVFAFDKVKGGTVLVEDFEFYLFEVDADGADPSAVTAAVLAGLERLTAR